MTKNPNKRKNEILKVRLMSYDIKESNIRAPV